MNSSTMSTCGTDAPWQAEIANLGQNVATLGLRDKDGRREIEIGGTRDVDGVTIVDVAGRVIFGQSYGRLPTTVKSIVSGSRKKIILDLSGVTYVDSYGLNDLVSSHLVAADCGAELKLVNVPEKVKYLLHLTKLDKVFDVFEEKAAAVLSFSG